MTLVSETEYVLLDAEPGKVRRCSTLTTCRAGHVSDAHILQQKVLLIALRLKLSCKSIVMPDLSFDGFKKCMTDNAGRLHTSPALRKPDQRHAQLVSPGLLQSWSAKDERDCNKLY